MKNRNTILLVIFFSLLLNPLLAQKTVDTDSLFTEAKKCVKANDYAKAEKLCNDILATKENGDVRFYLGLLYSWDGKYDDARKELKNVQETRPSTEEVIVALANNELWSDNPDAALVILNKALLEQPNNEEFLFLKAKALNNLKRYDEAIAVLNRLLTINPNNEKAKSLLVSIISANRKNGIMADFAADFFDHQAPWYLAYFQYLRKEKIGTFIARLNYAKRYGLSDFQFEADAYLNTSKSNYLYLNTGFSRAKLFPDYRFGAEFYQTFPRGFEASIGFRYLMFSSSEIVVYTGSIGKYCGYYWFSFRPYIIPIDNRISHSEVYQVRRFFGDTETYIGFQYTHGSSPDNIHTFLENADRLRLNSDEIKFTFNKRMALVWIGTVRVAYAREEYFEFQNRYSLEVSLQRLF